MNEVEVIEPVTSNCALTLYIPPLTVHIEEPPPPPPPRDDKSTEFPSPIVNCLLAWLNERVWSSVSTLLSDVAIDELNAVNPLVWVISTWDEPLKIVGRFVRLLYDIPTNPEPSPWYEPLNEPLTPDASDKLTEPPPPTVKSPWITEAVITPCICLLWINVAILSRYYLTLNQEIRTNN